VPGLSEDYIHRVGRTGRASAVGEAFTFVSPDEEGDLRAIEKAIGKRLPRVSLPDFDYTSRPTERFEVPIGERIAEIRKRKAEERARAKEKLERKSQRESEEATRRQTKAERPARPAGGAGRARPATAAGGQANRGGGSGGSGGSSAPSGEGSRGRRGGRGRGPGSAAPRGRSTDPYRE